jgi:hypothetical protein
MTTLRNAGRPKSDPTRIGGVRPSHLVTTGGVGAPLDLPSMSVIVRSLDTWSLERAEEIAEPRLLAQVQLALGGQVRALRKAPWDPADADNAYARSGVPVSPFPRWVRCPRCHRLGALDPPGQFSLVHRFGRRPDLAKWVHSGCRRQGQRSDAGRRACPPARFLVVCEAGHLDDFPYVEFVHAGNPCGGPKLTMTDSASTLSPRVNIVCEECDSRRNISQAAGRDGSEHLPRCRGRHPHLQSFESCGRKLRLIVLGSSNLWFSVTASALHLPQDRTVADLVAANWDLLGVQPNPEVVRTLIDRVPTMGDLRDVPLGEVWAAIEALKAADGPTATAAPGDLRTAEWEMLARPTTDRQDDDFRATPTPAPAGYEGLLDQVVQVSRLRVAHALLGFTRLVGPSRTELSPPNLLPLSRRRPEWIPAVEQRGEGVFLQLDESLVSRWEAAVQDHPRISALRGASDRWSANRDRPADVGFPAARYLLLHTLSHLLIRQVSLECGYSSAAIRERLYLGETGNRTAGILLSTAAPDSEGTLGGLVALGEARHLGRLLNLAYHDAARCSSDPLCAEHVPRGPDDSLHAAACHACLFASETSCEANNRWLDRAVLVDLTHDGLALTW